MDSAKLDALYAGLGCTGATSTLEKAAAVAEKCLEDLGKSEGTPAWLEYKASAERKATWEALGILPSGGSAAICEAQHRTHMGVDADLAHLPLQLNHFPTHLSQVSGCKAGLHHPAQFARAEELVKVRLLDTEYRQQGFQSGLYGLHGTGYVNTAKRLLHLGGLPVRTLPCHSRCPILGVR